VTDDRRLDGFPSQWIGDFDRNFDSGGNPARTVCGLENREVNWDDVGGTFDDEFGEPQLPEG
jgi:hypothetical protein